ncbi:hypothetical protein Dimus_035823, partial [Dionaea muscipula]
WRKAEVKVKLATTRRSGSRVATDGCHLQHVMIHYVIDFRAGGSIIIRLLVVEICGGLIGLATLAIGGVEER